MNKAIIIAGVMMGLCASSPPTQAQRYFINGHAASSAQARTLGVATCPSGRWSIDAWGMALAEAAPDQQMTTRNSDRECRYILDGAGLGSQETDREDQSTET